MKRTVIAVSVAVAAAAVMLAPVLLFADTSSCSLPVSSYADGVLNSPKGEDTEFFVSSGGVPNIMFVFDTSGSMRRLPPDGASLGWGSFGAAYGCSNAWANGLRYNSPCGNTVLDGKKFNETPGSPGPNFATDAVVDAAGNHCPAMAQGNQPPVTTGHGFDPDFYAQNSQPWFFQDARVYHDTIYSPTSVSDGWTDWATNPAAYATTTDFCAQWSADAAKTSSCNACMRDQGYFFDGSYMAAPIGSACTSTDGCKLHNEGTCVSDTTGVEVSGLGASGHCRLPNVWFSGNFLNFYPPKFVVARKVLKDVLMSVRKIRLGLTVFNNYLQGGVELSQGGTLLDRINPGCNMLGSPSNFDSNRTSIKNAINAQNQVAFAGSAPLAETLLDVGHLYTTRDLPWFNAQFDHTTFQDAVTTSNNKSVCFSCQASAALVITGSIPTKDGEIPGTAFAPGAMTTAVSNAVGSYAGMAGYNITGIGGADCPLCDEARNGGVNAEAADTTIAAGTCAGQQASGACDDLGNPIPAYLPKVAWYLKNLDSRRNTELGADALPMSGKQGITTYTIGLGTRGAASRILRDAAEAGGGLYNGGSDSDVLDARTLRDAIMRVFEDVNTRSLSFGSASMSTLQVASTQGVLVPRFEPARTAHWDGHLYAFDLFSEFSAGCTPADPAVSGPANGDFDCDGKCQSVFLKDRDGAFIQEDANGAFKKNLDPGKAPCSVASRCSTANCSAASTTDAVPFWDAGSKLAPVKKTTDATTGATTYLANPDFAIEWNQRNIYTVIDDAAPSGELTSADTLRKLGTAGAPASAFVPYLNIRGSRYCSNLAMRLTARANPAGATITSELAAGTYTTCAQVILDFVRGADVFNERGCSSFPTSYCTRRYQLGDIFHSSPVEVWAPLPSDGWACPRGQHPQCLPSLFSGGIPNPSVAGNGNAYDDYSKSTRYKTRKKFALVGANDGMLHAFRIERSDPQAGEELWAFIPPDLLPKLRLLLENVHHFYVDATPMVRDVWIDGSSNYLGTGSANGIRERSEFHTIAIVGERRGGTHYFALDVTDAAPGYADPKPGFMWLYPQPSDKEELAFGETYVDFLPKPPPIGPVRVDAGATPCANNAGTYQTAGPTRCFTEDWVVLLSGGFDPQYTKGRGIHMVEVGTGKELWDFSQPFGAASSCTAASDPRCHLNYPVAATAGMMMWGKAPAFLSAAAVDGYFDTATVGDTGGQIWVLRFNDPGIRDTTTQLVNNWFGARAFQGGLCPTSPASGVDYCASQPFFYINSNLPLAANGLYRTLGGTGDRFNILDPLGGVCGPDNIRACLLKGCTVKLQDAAGNAGAVYGVEPLLGTQSYGMDLPAACTGLSESTFTHLETGGGGSTCGTVVARVDGLQISCPSTTTCSGSAESTRKRVALSCTADSCDPASANELGGTIDLKTNPDKLNWFFSVLVFERVTPRTIFRTLDEAKAYDAARLKEGDLKNVNAYDTTRAVADLATPEGRGWSYFFNHGDPSTPSTVTVAGSAHHVYRTDERTTSASQVEYGCAFWNTLQAAVPAGAYDTTSGCPIDSPCKAGRAQISYLYGANAGTGGLCLLSGGEYVRSNMTETLAPPSMGKMVAYVGGGQVAFGLTSVRVPQGGANVQLGEAQDLVSPVEWLPVDRNTHACRHSDRNGAPPAPPLCQ